MFQELWSSPPEGQLWMRRAVILWTFETVYSVDDKAKKVVTKSPAGTSWRFLTAIDPTSQSHQQQALISSQKAAAADDDDDSQSPPLLSLLPPHLGYPAVGENYSPAWDSIPPPLTLQTQQHMSNAALRLGLTRHPRSLLFARPADAAASATTLPSSYPPTNAFDAPAGHHDLSSQLCLLPTSMVDKDGHCVFSDPSSYLSVGGDVAGGMYDDASPVDCDSAGGLHGWDASAMSAGLIDERLENWPATFNLQGTSQHNYGNAMLGWTHDPAPADDWATNSSTTPGLRHRARRHLERQRLGPRRLVVAPARSRSSSHHHCRPCFHSCCCRCCPQQRRLGRRRRLCEPAQRRPEAQPHRQPRQLRELPAQRRPQALHARERHGRQVRRPAARRLGRRPRRHDGSRRASCRWACAIRGEGPCAGRPSHLIGSRETALLPSRLLAVFFYFCFSWPGRSETTDCVTRTLDGALEEGIPTNPHQYLRPTAYLPYLCNTYICTPYLIEPISTYLPT